MFSLFFLTFFDHYRTLQDASWSHKEIYINNYALRDSEIAFLAGNKKLMAY